MIFTFYSYKGGVGRSMAMASVASLLARRGLRVLAMDFDLEAPGIERYFFEGERCKSVRMHPGFMDLIRAYRKALSSESAFEAGDFQRWQNFCLTAINTAGDRRACVDLMTAGTREPEEANRNYALTVRTFDWNDFFHNWKGDLFFDWLRRQLTNPQTGYDVVLVDSRTGVTEMGGVCAYQLADAAVLLCAPNYQNLDGTVDVVRDFRSDSVRALRRGRPLEILALPARLEQSHPGRAGFLQLFKEQLGVDGLPAVLARAGLDYEKLALPYLPQFAVAEQLVGDSQQQKTGLVPVDAAFVRLADALTLLAYPDTPLGRMRDKALESLKGGSTDVPMEFLADTTKSSAGYDVFVDYSPADLEMVQELARDFESRGHRTFVDKQQLNVGRDWQLSIDEALAYSSILLVCFGQPTDNERRAHIIATARRLQTVKIILVLLPGSDENAISSFDFSIQQAIDLHNWNDMAARERLSKLVEDASRPASRPFATVATVERDPYPGMRPFREDDASYFFGREDDLNSLEQALTDNDIVVVTGAAQIGKTSLVQAGLLPRLRQFDRDHALYFANIQCLDLATEQIQPRKGRSVKPELLLIDSIDTFEHEGSEAARNARLLWLQDVVDSASAGCKLVLVGRDAFGIESDFDLLGLTQRPRARSLVLKSLSREALGRAIEEPARRAAHLLEPGLVERLIESAGPAYNAIAQIQQVLFTIWSERKRGWLTNISLDSAGHLGGIVTLQHRRFLEQLTPYERTAASVLFGRLITLSASYAIVPVPQPWRIVSTIPALECVDAIALRDRLVRNGVIDLFRTTEVLELEKDLWETTIKLTRPDLSPYLELGGAQPDFRFLLWRDPNNANAERWKRDADAVLRGSALTEANQWLATHENQLTALERSFIMDSTRVYELEIRREHERQVTEQANREGRERERREAAEALAAVQTERLKVEQATIRRLIKGRIALLLLLAISVLLAGLAFVRSQQAQEAGILAKQEALRANAEAQRANAEAQRARAEKQSTEILLNNTSQARDALQAALAIANDARVAAESALEAPTQEARQLASEQLITLGNKIDAAQTSVSKLEDGCPVGQRFYIHIASDNDRAPAKALIRVLEAEGFIVPGIELVDTAPRQSAVRYFQAAEAPVAKKVAILLREQGIPGIVPTFISGYENSTNIRPCHYEIWFAMDAFARANKQ